MYSTLLIGGILGAMRIWMGFNVTPESFHWTQAYKDAAHLFMGGLFVAAKRDSQKWQWLLFWGLSALEVAVAVLSRM